MDTSTATTSTDAATGESAQDLDRQVVVFRLAQERYGVNIGTVREIIRRQAVTHVPSAPDSVEGMINLRGLTIPVVDLCKRLNLSLAEETDASRIIVLDTGEADIGVIVDEVMEVLRVAQSSISDAASVVVNSDTTYIDGIAQVDDSLLMLLDLDEALSAESMRAFKAKDLAPPPVVDEVEDQIDEIETPETVAPPVEPDQEPVVTEETTPEPAEDESGLPFDVALVQSTFELLAPRGEELVENFYALLLERHPAVAPLFEGVDMKQQRAKLLSALATVVATLRDLETLVPHLQELGRRHVGYGAEPAQCCSTRSHRSPATPGRPRSNPPGPEPTASPRR
jgi:purine-binding chemotaxis protein CheW